MWRIENIYRPYHEALRKLMAQSTVSFGHAVLVGLPFHALFRWSQREPDPGQTSLLVIAMAPSCNGDISREILKRFSELGYSTSRNKPYAGGFITEHYGRPLKGLHAVQIEINRGLYVNEATLEPTEKFADLAADIRTVLSHLVSLPDSTFGAASIAAE